MILYPAIDLKNGQCVRLRQGLMDQATVFNESPADQAFQFAQEGFSALHVVDLDGAFEGRSVNAKAVSSIFLRYPFPSSSAAAFARLKPFRSGSAAGYPA